MASEPRIPVKPESNQECPHSEADPQLYRRTGLFGQPRVPVHLDFRGLAKGHRSLSERGIIAGNWPRSTNNFNYLGPAAAVASRRLLPVDQGCSETPIFEAKMPVPAESWSGIARISGQTHFGKFSLADLVDVGRAGIDRGIAILHPFAVDLHRTLLDHAECFGGTGHQASFL